MFVFLAPWIRRYPRLYLRLALNRPHKIDSLPFSSDLGYFTTFHEHNYVRIPSRI